MSADLLRRAAAKLREHAQAATTGPWSEPYEADDTNPPEDRGWWVHGGTGLRERAVAVVLPYNPNAAADAALIALMHPPVALTVADLLDYSARWFESAEKDGYEYDEDEALPVIALARAILREAGNA